jgi:hypothetical protein
MDGGDVFPMISSSADFYQIPFYQIPHLLNLTFYQTPFYQSPFYQILDLMILIFYQIPFYQIPDLLNLTFYQIPFYQSPFYQIPDLLNLQFYQIPFYQRPFYQIPDLLNYIRFRSIRFSHPHGKPLKEKINKGGGVGWVGGQIVFPRPLASAGRRQKYENLKNKKFRKQLISEIPFDETTWDKMNYETGVVDGQVSRDAACHAGGSGFDSRSRPDLRLVWKSGSFL